MRFEEFKEENPFSNSTKDGYNRNQCTSPVENENSVCLQSLVKKIKNTRKLNRVIMNKHGEVQPKINI